MCGVRSTHNGLRFTYSGWNSTHNDSRSAFNRVTNFNLYLRISGVNYDALFIRFILLSDIRDPRSAVQRFSNTHQGVIDDRQIGIAISKGLIRQIDIHRQAREILYK